MARSKELLEKLSEILEEMDYDDDPNGEYNDEGIKYITVNDPDWISSGKYEGRTVVFHFPELEVYVSVDMSRSGSYYTDYYYNDPDIYFVVPKTKTITITEYYKAGTDE